MAIATSPNHPSGDVRANIVYFSPPADGSVPYNIIDANQSGPPPRNYGDNPIPTEIHDIRGHESRYTLDRDSFKVILNVPDSAEREFTDDESIKERYYPEVEQLLLSQIPGARRVVIFDHTVRRPVGNRTPVNRAHIDQTAHSAVLRVRKHVSEEDAEKLLRGRYRIVNVWRPLNKRPVESNPLAFASSYSVADEDIVPVEHRYTNGYTGETAGIKHNPSQKWNYLSGMTGNERLLLQCCDSEAAREGSGVQGGRLPHSAFEDPRTRPDAEGRESIEVRTLVFGP